MAAVPGDPAVHAVRSNNGTFEVPVFARFLRSLKELINACAIGRLDVLEECLVRPLREESLVPKCAIV